MILWLEQLLKIPKVCTYTLKSEENKSMRQQGDSQGDFRAPLRSSGGTFVYIMSQCIIRVPKIVCVHYESLGAEDLPGGALKSPSANK